MPRRDREQSILDAAGQVFARGYHGASMDQIAGLADVSKPMLYAYFGSKEGLYVAYVDRTGRELLARLAGATTPDDQPSVRLRAGILEFLAFIEEHRDGWQVLFGELTSIGPVVDEVAVLRRRIAEWIMAVLAGATRAQGHVPDISVEATAHAIVGAGESLANWWLEHPDVRRDQVADWYMGMILAAASAATGEAASRELATHESSWM
jgi:AcrR family transcriptional regulator